MKFIKTKIEGLTIIEPKIFGDDRGYFLETYNQETFGSITFVQDNESKSSYGVLRGLHYQEPPFEQAKLVRVIQGSVLDVAVDIRKNSPTFGKHVSIELNDQNKKQLFIPTGFAHGFVVISETAIFSYKVDNYYNREFDRGIAFNDKVLDINWRIKKSEIKISKKDNYHPLFCDI